MTSVSRFVVGIALLTFVSPALSQQRLIIRGGQIVDVESGALRPNGSISLEGDRILAVSESPEDSPGATIIDANGKYLLPGLIDLHVHYRDWAGPLYLNHGVTTVVDLGSPHEWIQIQREGIQSGFIEGPRLLIGTRNLEGPKDENYYLRGYVRIVKDPQEAISAMREFISENVDAVKVYDGLGLETLRKIVQEADKANIPVIGHFRDVRIAAQAGAHGIEHIGAVANTIVDVRAREEALKKVRKGLDLPAESFIDLGQLPAVAKLMVENGLYLNPTLRMSWGGDRGLRQKGLHYQDFDLLFNNWRLRFVPLDWRLAALKEYQEIGLWHWADLSQYEQDLFHQGYKNAQKVVRAHLDAGGKLYAGTDSASMTTPGLSMHQELELLVDAGATPLQALQAATINPAELMRKPDRLGTLERGKVGDVLILEGNPLEDIRNIRKIASVISRGRVLDLQYQPRYKNPVPSNAWEGSSHFFPSPRIRQVSPLVFEQNFPKAVLEVEGTGFIPYSYIRFNGQELETTFESGRQLKADIPAELLKPGTYSVTVSNPDFGGGSNLASGASDLAHLGLRGFVSNEFKVLVKPR